MGGAFQGRPATSLAEAGTPGLAELEASQRHRSGYPYPAELNKQERERKAKAFAVPTTTISTERQHNGRGPSDLAEPDHHTHGKRPERGKLPLQSAQSYRDERHMLWKKGIKT